MKSYIVESAKAAKQTTLFGKPVSIVHPFTNKLDFDSVIRHIEEKLPEPLAANFEGIYVGKFKDVPFNALFKDGVIYVTNDQDNEVDLLDDIIHEIAHSLEETNDDLIYSDQQLETEFLSKRRRMHYLVDKPTMNIVYYLSPDYQANFDDHLHRELGYDYLRTLTSNLFYSPYAITSLREYWANGFENYLLGDKRKLKDLSPVLYSKIEQIFDNVKE
jgi:hypothetical protein